MDIINKNYQQKLKKHFSSDFKKNNKDDNLVLFLLLQLHYSIKLQVKLTKITPLSRYATLVLKTYI